MMAVLTSMGVIVLLTSELEDHYADLRFSPYGNAFLADTILMLRYIEIEGDLKRIISVVKISVSDHKTALHFFCIAGEGILMGESLSQYTGILTGSPVKWAANPLI